MACGAGFTDGLGLGDNTKAAVIRLGLMEMIKFVDTFFPGSKLSTFFESCGVADLITTCYGGRNRRVSEAFVKTGKVCLVYNLCAAFNSCQFSPLSESNFAFVLQSIPDLEAEMLNGQKLQGPITAEEVNVMLKGKNMENKYVLDMLYTSL